MLTEYQAWRHLEKAFRAEPNGCRCDRRSPALDPIFACSLHGLCHGIESLAPWLMMVDAQKMLHRITVAARSTGQGVALRDRYLWPMSPAGREARALFAMMQAHACRGEHLLAMLRKHLDALAFDEPDVHVTSIALRHDDYETLLRDVPWPSVGVAGEGTLALNHGGRSIRLERYP